MSERINARLSQPLAEFVDRMVGEAGLYETPSEYVRDLIRRDMNNDPNELLRQRLISGYKQLGEGNFREIPVSEIYDRVMKRLDDEGVQLKD